MKVLPPPPASGYKYIMGSNPINLAIRFLLELIALASIGLWGWELSNGIMKYILAIGLPVIAGTVWGTFAVPNDPSRSGKAPVAVHGAIRLVIELSFFYFATWALYDLGYTKLSWIVGVVVIIHYLISYDRIYWLLKQ